MTVTRTAAGCRGCWSIQIYGADGRRQSEECIANKKKRYCSVAGNVYQVLLQSVMFNIEVNHR